jgi:hypothetical protein
MNLKLRLLNGKESKHWALKEGTYRSEFKFLEWDIQEIIIKVKHFILEVEEILTKL